MHFDLYGKYLSNLLSTLKNGTSEEDSSTDFRIVIRGYGPRSEIKKIRFNLDNQLGAFRVTSRPIFAMYHHSIDELNTRAEKFTFRSPKHAFRELSKKIIALSLQSKRLYLGLFSGFTLTIDIPEGLKSESLNVSSAGSLWVSRRVARSGISIPDLESTLEYAFRRKELNSVAVLLSVNLFPISKKTIHNLKNSLLFEGAIDYLARNRRIQEAEELCRFIPSWHGARSFFTLIFDTNSFAASNVYEKATLERTNGVFRYKPENIDSQITWTQRPNFTETVFAKFLAADVTILGGKTLVVDNHVLSYDISTSEEELPATFWPRSNWTISSSKFVALASVNSKVFEYANVLFISNIDNWAHFIEDVLPRVILASSTDNFEAILIGGKIIELNKEAIQRFTKAPIFTLATDSKISAKRCVVVVQEIRRALAQSGNIENLSLVDFELMRMMREKLQPAMNVSSKRIYIKRSNKQFRRLLNKKRLEKFLIDNGFETIFAERLDLQERLNLFASAEVIVAESGAGLVNCYFCKQDVTVIEIRHPGMRNNLEYIDAKKICLLDYQIVNGKSPSIFSQIFLGSDTFKIDIKSLKEKLDLL